MSIMPIMSKQSNESSTHLKNPLIALRCMRGSDSRLKLPLRALHEAQRSKGVLPEYIEYQPASRYPLIALRCMRGSDWGGTVHE